MGSFSENHIDGDVFRRKNAIFKVVGALERNENLRENTGMTIQYKRFDIWE